jgi:hypothetical protein
MLLNAPTGHQVRRCGQPEPQPVDVVVDPLLQHQRSCWGQHAELMERSSPIDTAKELLITVKMILGLEIEQQHRPGTATPDREVA